MSGHSASVPYTPYGTVDASGGGGTPMGVHATPQDFGAQVGEALEGAGKQGFDAAMKQQGMINETVMTNADANFATKVGELKGGYTSLTGMAAYNAFPQYQQDVRTAFQEERAKLPAAAQRGFDLMAARSMANHIADGSSYASSQLKDAQRDSYTSLAGAQFAALLDPDVAASKERSAYHLDSLAYAAQAQIDDNHPGLKADEKTGAVSFDDSPEGQSLKSQHEQQRDTYLSQGYVNRYSTLAKMDVFNAYDEYRQEREKLPRSAQVELDALFAPKLFNAHVQNTTGNAIGDAQRQHWDILTNPSSIGSHANNLGNVKTASGAAKGTPEFVNPATPIDGTILAANTLRSGYQGLTLQQIGAKWTGEPKQKVADWVNNTSTASGISPDAVPDLNNPQQLAALLKGIATAEKSPEDRARFSDGIIAQGAQASLAGDQPNASNAKSYATNDNGGPLTLADYYRTHSQEVLARGDAYAEQVMPGDLAMRRAVRQSLENHMNKTISNESAQHLLDNRNIVRAINGELTNNNPPETESDLRAIPGMSDLLDNVATRDPKFAESIPTMIAKVARRNNTANSANGYETILRVLEPNDYDNPNRIGSQDHLAKLLGRSDGTGINYKDYTDAKESIESPDKWKAFLSKNMKEIATANGNVDGMGQKRAIQFYNAATELYKKKTQDKVTVPDMINPESKDYINIAGNYMIPRANQIQNIAQKFREGRQQEMSTFSSPDDPEFAKLPSGTQFMVPGESVPRVKK